MTDFERYLTAVAARNAGGKRGFYVRRDRFAVSLFAPAGAIEYVSLRMVPAAIVLAFVMSVLS